MGEGTLFSQHCRLVALFPDSVLFGFFRGSSGPFRPRNGARMALGERRLRAPLDLRLESYSRGPRPRTPLQMATTRTSSEPTTR